MNCSEWGLLVALSALWGGSFLFAEIALRELPPVTIVFCRVVIAALILHAVLRLSGRRGPAPDLWPGFIAMGLLNNCIPFTLIVWGQSHIASGLAAILNATTPLFTVVLARIFADGKPIPYSRALGVVTGFSGVALMIGWDPDEESGVHIMAQVAVLLAACSYALAAIYGQRFRGVSPVAAASGQLTASSLLLLPVALFMDRPWQLALPSAKVGAALLGIGVLSTALAYVLYFRILAGVGAVNLLLVTFLIPVSAVLLGALFLHESMHADQVIGIAVIGCALITVDGRLITALSRRGRGANDPAPPTRRRSQGPCKPCP